MMRWIDVAVVAGALALVVPASATEPTTAKPEAAAQQRQSGRATNLTAHRKRRHVTRYDHPYGHGPYYGPAYGSYYPPYGPRYYGRPAYYQPYPYVWPAPFTFGFGFGPYW
jgi:hypothetical protein